MRLFLPYLLSLAQDLYENSGDIGWIIKILKLCLNFFVLHTNFQKKFSIILFFNFCTNLLHSYFIIFVHFCFILFLAFIFHNLSLCFISRFFLNSRDKRIKKADGVRNTLLNQIGIQHDKSKQKWCLLRRLWGQKCIF